MSCIFCSIAKGEVRSKVIYQDDQAIAFHDINPKAPVHILIIPRKHIDCVADLQESDEHLMGHLINIASKLARENGVAASGFRLVINCGPEGGQIVPHLHIHLLGGRQLGKMG